MTTLLHQRRYRHHQLVSLWNRIQNRKKVHFKVFFFFHFSETRIRTSNVCFYECMYVYKQTKTTITTKIKEKQQKQKKKKLKQNQ